MFQFTTTTVINGAKTVSGKDSYEIVEKANGDKIFRVYNGPQFVEGDAIDVFVAPFKAEANDKVVVSLADCDTTKYYRIAMYIRSVGNADPMYANDFVFKGKPLYIEFKGDATAEDVKYIADKFLLAIYDEKVLEVTADGTDLTIEAVNGYQRFHHVALEQWDEDTTVEGGHFNVFKNFTADVEVGCEGYGTYEQVLKDLRLPTGDNLARLSLNETEMPVLGGEYVQVTVRMCKDLVNYPGGIGVNNPVKSITNHVFFVNGADLADEFVADLESVVNISSEEVPEVATTTGGTTTGGTTTGGTTTGGTVTE